MAFPQAATSGPTFEVEHFGWAAAGGLEVAGRWYGVRGRRFVRPSLDVDGPQGRRRVLASLEHKPWAPAEGEPWVAAFPWEDGDPAPANAELAVAPGVVVGLPSLRSGPRAGDQARRAPVEPAVTAELEGDEAVAALLRRLATVRAEHAATSAERDDAVSARGALERERDEAVAALGTLERERDGAVAAWRMVERERDEAVAARDAARGDRMTVERERDAAMAARDAAVAAQEAAAAAGEAARRELAAAQREREEALAGRDAHAAAAPASAAPHGGSASDLRSERDALQREVEAMKRERAAARRERNELLSRTSANLAARAEAERERAAAVRERDDAVRERDDVLAQRDQALAQCDVAVERLRALEHAHQGGPERDAPPASEPAMAIPHRPLPATPPVADGRQDEASEPRAAVTRRVTSTGRPAWSQGAQPEGERMLARALTVAVLAIVAVLVALVLSAVL